MFAASMSNLNNPDRVTAVINEFKASDTFFPGYANIGLDRFDYLPGFDTFGSFVLVPAIPSLPETSNPTVRRLCCCGEASCPVNVPAIDIGWVLGAKGESCSTTCSSQDSACHEASQKAANTKAELKYVLAQAGQGSFAQSLDKTKFCAYPHTVNPSVVLPATSKTAQYNGASSTCDAVPTGGRQRLCCCSPTGCATTAA